MLSSRKIKHDTKLSIFVFSKFFNVFGFFLKIKNNLKNKTNKNRNKTCPQINERIKSKTNKQHSP